MPGPSGGGRPTQPPAQNRGDLSSKGLSLQLLYIYSLFKQTETAACRGPFCLCTRPSPGFSAEGCHLPSSGPAGRLLGVFQFCTVTRVSHHELLNQYFVVIHNFLSIIHANVCVVYLIVLLTIKSNFLKVLKDTKFNQRNYFSDAMLLSILNLLNSSLIYVPFWRKYEFNQTIRLKS